MFESNKTVFEKKKKKSSSRKNLVLQNEKVFKFPRGLGSQHKISVLFDGRRCLKAPSPPKKLKESAKTVDKLLQQRLSKKGKYPLMALDDVLIYLNESSIQKINDVGNDEKNGPSKRKEKTIVHKFEIPPYFLASDEDGAIFLNSQEFLGFEEDEQKQDVLVEVSNLEGGTSVEIGPKDFAYTIEQGNKFATFSENDRNKNDSFDLTNKRKVVNIHPISNEPLSPNDFTGNTTKALHSRLVGGEPTVNPKSQLDEGFRENLSEESRKFNHSGCLGLKAFLNRTKTIETLESHRVLRGSSEPLVNEHDEISSKLEKKIKVVNDFETFKKSKSISIKRQAMKPCSRNSKTFQGDFKQSFNYSKKNLEIFKCPRAQSSTDDNFQSCSGSISSKDKCFGLRTSKDEISSTKKKVSRKSSRAFIQLDEEKLFEIALIDKDYENLKKAFMDKNLCDKMSHRKKTKSLFKKYENLMSHNYKEKEDTQSSEANEADSHLLETKVFSLSNAISKITAKIKYYFHLKKNKPKIINMDPEGQPDCLFDLPNEISSKKPELSALDYNRLIKLQYNLQKKILHNLKDIEHMTQTRNDYSYKIRNEILNLKSKLESSNFLLKQILTKNLKI